MSSRVEIDAKALIDIRDEVAVIRDLVVSLCLACSSSILPRDERAGLSQLVMLVRDRLKTLAASLDQLATPRQAR